MFELISHEVEKKYKIFSTIYKNKLIELFLNKMQYKIFDKAFIEIKGKIPEDWELFVKNVVLKIYRNGKVNIHLWEEAIRVLNILKGNNVLLALITNGNLEVQKNKIKLLKIENVFDRIYISDSYKPPERKPSTRMFEDFLGEFNLNSNEVIHIGDDEKLDGAALKVNISFYKINSKYDWNKFLYKYKI
ncbi:hypothetical protein X275_09535 [Marinitoga sp. 1197]|nr:hypothetical protein X275_09535 [Marinitoga sp. 1197]